MSNRSFVHLHCHTHYSLLDGASRIPELVAHVKANGMNAVAMTDHGNLYGAVQLYNTCKANDINPIIGYEAYVAPGKLTDRESKKRGEVAYHLTLLAKNFTGLQNLIKMSSIAFLEGYYYVPRIDKDVLEAHSEGLICLSGCASAEFSEFILQDRMDDAIKTAQYFSKLFGKNFYIEIQNNGLKIQRACMEGAIEVANKLGLPLVATSDAHYLKEADAEAHDVLLCINTGKKRNDANRMRYGDGDGKMVSKFYVRPPEEMYELFPDHAEAVARSQEIANSVDIEIDFNKRYFPVFTPPDQKTSEDYLRELCEIGMKERYGEDPPQAAWDRLDMELGIINRMGYASYFLITHDFVRFAIEQGIPQTARGSGVGAIVSYVLKISHVCPLEYDLLFERFLDPNRKEPPDIDIDFCQDRREEVIQYVKQKYGEESVAQIGTFGTLAARAAIKDVGRVLDVQLGRVNQLTNFVPKRPKVTIDDALAESPELRTEYDRDPEVKELIDIAKKLEGTNRNTGTHAAGVVISDGPLMNYVPLQRVVRKDKSSTNGNKNEVLVTTQWEMGDLENYGMLKMDFLGLRTLTLLANALDLIEKTRGEKVDLDTLPLDDRETYALLCRGDAKGVFQLESEGMRELLKRMKPDNIRDIIAVLALYRPGPLQGGMVDAFINFKHGIEQPTYVHPVMEEVLSETYSVIVYQEQIMRILNRLGGIPLSSSYACIKAISKKKQAIIDQREADFYIGTKERGVEESTAKDIWNKIVQFASYGFNKSHTTAYAHIGYHTAYLKAHYTAEFMAALLTSEIEDGNKRDIMVEHIDDAERLGVKVLPPDVNLSEPDFTVVEGQIVFGLTAIKGFGRSAGDEVSKVRAEGGPFKDFFDFCERVDHRVVNKSAIEKLIKAGALDKLGGNRAQYECALERALTAAQERQRDRRMGQGNLFESIEAADGTNGVKDELPNIEDWSDKQKLRYEKDVLDFYLSSHPLAEHETVLNRYTTHTTLELPTVELGKSVTIGGMLTRVRPREQKTTRRGNSRMLSCFVEDMQGEVECVMWADDFASVRVPVEEEMICFVRGTRDDRRNQFMLTEILTLEQIQKEACGEVWLRLSLEEHQPWIIDTLAKTLERFPGSCPVWMTVIDPAGKKSHLKLGPGYRINPLAFNVAELETLLGKGSVKLIPARGR